MVMFFLCTFVVEKLPNMRKTILLSFLVLFFISTKAQKTQLDRRALNYYSQEQIAKMPNSKIKQINFLYQESFIIPEEFKTQINKDDIDIRDYSKQRLKDKRAKVFVINKNAKRETGSEKSIYFYLLSIEELQQAYKKIK